MPATNLLSNQCRHNMACALGMGKSKPVHMKKHLRQIWKETAWSSVEDSKSANKHLLMQTRTKQSVRCFASVATPDEKVSTLKFNVLEVLKARGLVQDVTNEDGLLSELQNNTKQMTVYCGFDPTADSLHLGNLLGIIVMSWFARAGHKVIGLCGGATGLVGDPSGKSAERPMLDVSTLNHNTHCIGKQLSDLLEVEDNGLQIQILNNLQWFEQMTFLTFLRDIGKYARVGTMLAKDSVKSRMENSTENEDDDTSSGSGMSFTEFSYQLLQGYDFFHLYKNFGCRLQVGGSDQWGNITAGTDLIRKLCNEDQDVEKSDKVKKNFAYGITFPLLVGSDGKKFGKSEGGAIWLDKDKLSPYHMYQHLLRTPDSDVVLFLKRLTFLDLERIGMIEEQMSPDHPKHEGPNAAQKVLAMEVTRFVHGESGVEEALKITKGLFESQKNKNDPPTLESFEALVLSGSAPKAQLLKQDIVGVTVPDILVKVGLQPSKSAAKRMLKGGGIRVNNQVVGDESETIQEKQLVDSRFLLLAAGKKNKMIVEVQSA